MISGSRKQHVKSLSSNQLFLGVFQSLRRDSPIQAKSEVSKHLQLSSAFSPENAEVRLKQVFERRLNLANWAMINIHMPLQFDGLSTEMVPFEFGRTAFPLKRLHFSQKVNFGSQNFRDFSLSGEFRLKKRGK
jgi:hypothetical protein